MFLNDNPLQKEIALKITLHCTAHIKQYDSFSCKILARYFIKAKKIL